MLNRFLTFVNNLSNFGEKHYIKSIITSFLLFLFFVLGINTSFLYSSILNYSHIKAEPFDGAVYPIEYIPNPLLLTRDERNARFDEINSKYFVKLPKYNIDTLLKDPETLPIGSEKYIETVISRIAYTVVYMGNYKFDYKEYAGSHPSIDIVAPVGTPIRSIANGVVVKSGYEAGGFGNYLVVRHDNVPLNGEKTSIFSSYSHMDEKFTKPGELVGRGQMIGTVGNTGMSTASHVDFQIALEDSPFLPFRPFSGSEARSEGLGFFSGINEGLGFENGIKYTINPLEFVNNNLNNNFSDNILADNNDELYLSNKEDEIKDETITVDEIREEDIIEESIINEDTVLEKDDIKKEIIIDEEEEKIIKNINREELVDLGLEIISDENDIVLLDNVELAILSNVDNLLGIHSELVADNYEELEILFEDLENSTEFDIDEIEETINNESNEQELLLDKTIDINNIFSDIDNNYPYFEQIKYFKDNEIISGFSDNTFRPNNNITRAEGLKVILLGLGFDPTYNQQSNFNDINSNSWENTFINSGINLGIIDTNNTNFYPFRNISRIEGLKLILELGGVNLENLSHNVSYNDIENDAWYYDYVTFASKNNLLDTDGNNFFPNRPLTRQELVNLVYRYIN